MGAIKEADTKPETLLNRNFSRMIYGNHAYGLRGSGETTTVAAVTRDDLERFYRRYYSANRAVVAMMGRITERPVTTLSVGFQEEAYSELPEARELIEKALKLAPEDAFIMDSMGWVLFRQGQLSEALTYLRRAFELRSDPEIAAHLGEVLWASGNREEAERIFKDGLNKNPGNDVLLNTLKRIKLGRLGQMEDLTGAIVFLASDAAALMTGTSLVVDGGWTAE